MKKINFEESLERLEEITAKMESSDITLDESLKLFEEGIKLSRFCEQQLTEAEQKLEILKNTDITDVSEESDEDSPAPKEKKSKKKSEFLKDPEKSAFDPEKKDSFLF